MDLMQYGQDTQDPSFLRGPDPVPEGFYPVAIAKGETKSDPKTNTDGVLFRFSILSGQFRGRSIGSLMAIRCPSNPEREGYARRDFVKLNLSVGGPFPTPEHYVGKQLVVKVTVSNKTASGDPENFIRGFFPAGYNPETKSVDPGYQQPQQQPPQGQYQPPAQQQPPQGQYQPPQGYTQAPPAQGGYQLQTPPPGNQPAPPAPGGGGLPWARR